MRAITVAAKAHNGLGAEVVTVRVGDDDVFDAVKQVGLTVLFCKMENVRTRIDQQRAVDQRRRVAAEKGHGIVAVDVPIGSTRAQKSQLHSCLLFYVSVVIIQ